MWPVGVLFWKLYGWVDAAKSDLHIIWCLIMAQLMPCPLPSNLYAGVDGHPGRWLAGSYLPCLAPCGLSHGDSNFAITSTWSRCPSLYWTESRLGKYSKYEKTKLSDVLFDWDRLERITLIEIGEQHISVLSGYICSKLYHHLSIFTNPYQQCQCQGY